jgi:hypothetical protein
MNYKKAKINRLKKRNNIQTQKMITKITNNHKNNIKTKTTIINLALKSIYHNLFRISSNFVKNRTVQTELISKIKKTELLSSNV